MENSHLLLNMHHQVSYELCHSRYILVSIWSIGWCCLSLEEDSLSNCVKDANSAIKLHPLHNCCGDSLCGFET
ncbi:hypothetical protein AQUCO_00700940v1 [Aquilegia coerulea]|uniref:Uncharacterized protein n=1 Tax=Aquilegia coerulea TaxID=218851 RepID=A0A2G5EMK7_AQUCA|nr:hypothetical protein AQUCO_00700940v1 [Aquilegia coerulea]